MEDATDLLSLREFGIDLAQGYLFAAPLSASDLVGSGWLQSLIPQPQPAA